MPVPEYGYRALPLRTVPVAFLEMVHFPNIRTTTKQSNDKFWILGTMSERGLS